MVIKVMMTVLIIIWFILTLWLITAVTYPDFHIQTVAINGTDNYIVDCGRIRYILPTGW